MKSLTICTAHQILFGRKNRENEMGGACRAYRGGEEPVQDFGGEA